MRDKNRGNRPQKPIKDIGKIMKERVDRRIGRIEKGEAFWKTPQKTPSPKAENEDE